MTDHLLAVSALELLVGGVCLWLAARCLPYRSRATGPPVLALCLAAAGWAFSAGLASLVPDPTVTRWAQLATYGFVGAAALAWFGVAVTYTGRDWWTQRPVAAALGALLAVDWLLILTDPFHHGYIAAGSAVGPGGIFDPTPGPLLWLMALWKVGFIALGSAFVLRRRAIDQGVFRVQSLAILFAGVVPVVAAVSELLDLVSVRGLDLGVLGVAAASAVVLWALFAADFTDIVPIARATLLESLPDAVVAVDAAGRVVDLNSAAKALFDTDGDAVGDPAATVLPVEVPAAGAPVAIASETGPVTIDVDGEPRTFDVTVSPIPTRRDPGRHTDGGVAAPLGALLVFCDVTVQRQRQAELEVKNARLEQFSSMVSHDLRNPLTVAHGRLELARAEQDSEHFEPMGRALARMDELIDDLLTLARQGKLVTEREPVAIAGLARTCWANVDTDRARLVAATDLVVSADRSRLEALFENLLRNSVEHGGPAVTITVGDLDDGAGFFVADDGPGVPEAERERVFEAGYSERADGTGLGLAIVAEIAEAHGWTVEMTESEAGGARFEFRVAELASN